MRVGDIEIDKPDSYKNDFQVVVGHILQLLWSLHEGDDILYIVAREGEYNQCGSSCNQ